MWMHHEMSDEGRRYWTTKRYCFNCKRVRLFERCGNCNKYFCPHCSGEWQEPELGDYGSEISPAYMAHTKC